MGSIIPPIPPIIPPMFGIPGIPAAVGLSLLVNAKIFPKKLRKHEKLQIF